jgi:hypothetical protein
MQAPPFDQRLLLADLGIDRVFQQLPVAHRGGQFDQRGGLGGCETATEPTLMQVSAMDFAASFSVASMRNVLLARHDDGKIKATTASGDHRKAASRACKFWMGPV